MFRICNSTPKIRFFHARRWGVQDGLNQLTDEAMKRM